MDSARLVELLRAGDYVGLEAALIAADLGVLARSWCKLSVMDRLVCFKLLDATRALEFYGRLDFERRYEILCAFPLQSIAPVLEPLGVVERTRFVQLPREFYDRMFRQLLPTEAKP